MRTTLSIGFVFVFFILIGQDKINGNPAIPGAQPDTPIAIVGATIFPVTSAPIEDGTLLIDKGKIIALGTHVDIPRRAKRIAAPGRSIYPGLFNSDGLLGLVEINSVRATRDFAETGDLNPNLRVETAVNPDSELIPVTRSGGVLLSLSVPRGGLISGASAILQMDGWTWEEMTLEAPVGIHINWPRVRWTDGAGKGQGKAADSIQRLRLFFEQSRAYLAAGEIDPPPPVDLKLAAMRPLLLGEIPMIVTAETAAQIQSAVAFSVEQSVRIIIYGGYDAESCASLLKAYDVPVIIGGIHRLPRRRSDPYDAPFTLPNRLRLAGVEFCIAARDSFDAPNTRNLPYQAAHAVAFGLPHDEALKSITISPAKILGVSDRVGSLEVGKDATLIVTDGDPLETPTHVEQAYIQGRPVDLSDRHKRLWEKYRERLRRFHGKSLK